MVVADGLAAHSGPECIEGPGGNGGCSGSAGFESPVLASCLVEPDANVALPVLAQVHVGNHVVVLNHTHKLILILIKYIP